MEDDGQKRIDESSRDVNKRKETKHEGGYPLRRRTDPTGYLLGMGSDKITGISARSDRENISAIVVGTSARWLAEL